MDRKAGVAYLSSSDGTLLEISESKLSEDDLNYIRSIGHKVTSYLFHFPFRSLNNFGTDTATGYESDRSGCHSFSSSDRIWRPL